MVRRAAYAYVALMVVSLVLSGASLLGAISYYHTEQRAQQRQGEVLEAKLCTTLGRLAALKPPAGSPAANPSRAFEQALAGTLAELGPDVGCKENR